MHGLAASGRCPLPVICTVGALLDRGVLSVPNQPNESGVSPQADVLPGLLRDVAAACIEVTHENEILKEMIWRLSHLVSLVAQNG